MVHLIITVALRSELPDTIEEQFGCPVFNLREISQDSFSPPSFFVLITGIGLERSKCAAEQISCFSPAMVLNLGTCGAMTTTLKIGDWVQITECYLNEKIKISNSIYKCWYRD